MPAFAYKAYTARGKSMRGVLSAEDERHARRLLREKALQPYEVRVQAESNRPVRRRFSRQTRLGNFDLSLLLRQLAILLQSGLPLDTALRLTREQAESARQRQALSVWLDAILEGRSLSQALGRSGARIPDSVLAGLAVGEESGHLDRVMLRLADELENAAENRKTVTRALIYPATLVLTSLVVVAVMMVWVVPKITLIFASSQRSLPWVTQVIITLSDFVQQWGLLCLGAGTGLAVLSLTLLRVPRYRLRWHDALLRLPALGRWLRMAAIADWARSMGTLLHTGVPALAALRISSAVVDNLALRARFDEVTRQVHQGSSLHKALQQSQAGSGFLVHMVSSGEASSELDAMLLRVADYYSLRLRSAVEVFLKVLNPLLIILMGVIILSVVAAVMLPIMDMNNMI